MNWLEVTIDTTPDKLELLCADLEALGVAGLIIEDEDSVLDFIERECNVWEHVEDDVLAPVRGVCRVRFYLEDSPGGVAELARIHRALGGPAPRTAHVRDEDWADNWRQYYKPVTSGARLLILPAWETEFEPEGRTVLRLDPKQAFGNGTHASTRMCLEELERHAPAHVLDIGCGSGILAIAALLLGAETAVGCDIVPDAAEIVSENATLNGFAPGKIPVHTGDILTDRALLDTLGVRKYDLIFLNIVTDVIIPLIPVIPPLLEEEGVLICSGIIHGRQEEARAALEAGGFTVLAALQMENWHAFACKRSTLMVK